MNRSEMLLNLLNNNALRLLHCLYVYENYCRQNGNGQNLPPIKQNIVKILFLIGEIKADNEYQGKFIKMNKLSELLTVTEGSFVKAVNGGKNSLSKSVVSGFGQVKNNITELSDLSGFGKINGVRSNNG